VNKVCVVRVGTEAFKRGDTYFYGRTIRVIKKKTDVDYLHDDCQQVGTQEAIENILNIHTVEDGIHQLVMCNVSKDWETGYVDDFNFKLVPFEELK
jgi:hypothetical protein